MNVKLIATSSRDLMGEACSKRPTRERAMIVKSRIIHFAAACLVLALAACGGGGDGGARTGYGLVRVLP